MYPDVPRFFVFFFCFVFFFVFVFSHFVKKNQTVLYFENRVRSVNAEFYMAAPSLSPSFSICLFVSPLSLSLSLSL